MTSGPASAATIAAAPPSTAPSPRAAGGLTQAEVSALQALHGRNAIAPANRHLWWSTIRGALTEDMFLLLLIASGLYGLVGDMAEALTLLALVAAVLLLTVVQSHRTASVLEALRDLSAPRAQVLRDGQREYVPDGVGARRHRLYRGGREGCRPTAQ
ncbi:cation-transporting P-type ATPase [Paraburkholderia sp. RL17-373-BIF-A]